jgi:ubiquinone/menaquinone biosynthesis C-methylase UbiE
MEEMYVHPLTLAAGSRYGARPRCGFPYFPPISSATWGIVPHNVVEPDTDVQHRAYFSRQLEANEEFWRRFGKRPDLAGMTVLDLGCGHGAMTLEIAGQGGAALGVDLNADLIQFARRNLAQTAPELMDRVEFQTVDLKHLGLDRHFDVAISKDTFEHVEDMGAMMRTLFHVLKPGGELWAGFAPLFWSPWGDHTHAGLKLPWAHAVLPRRFVLRAAARHRRRPVRDLGDLGLNGMTPREFRGYLDEAGFEVVSIAYNRGNKRFMGTLAGLRRVPPLERFATVNIYTVARRPELKGATVAPRASEA